MSLRQRNGITETIRVSLTTGTLERNVVSASWVLTTV